MQTTPLKQTIPEHVEAVVKNALKSSFAQEGLKGCVPSIHSHPLDLEPPFEEYQLRDFLSTKTEPKSAQAPKRQPRRKLIAVRVWVPQKTEYKWEIFEDMTKQFASLQAGMSFEIIGNSKRISIQFVLSPRDLPPLSTTLESLFPGIRLERLPDPRLFNRQADLPFDFLDYYPEPPYWRTLTVHDEFGLSPLEPVYTALSQIRGSELGVYQVLLKPTSPNHDWKRNIENLVDTEYKANYESYFNPSTLYAQVPSYYLPKVNEKEERKAHPDKPLFAVIVKIGVFGKRNRTRDYLRTLHQFSQNFLFGGRPLHCLSIKDYEKASLGGDSLLEMFQNRLSYRHGMILNSSELCGFCHFPTTEILQSRGVRVDGLKGLPVPQRLTDEGVLIGVNRYAGKSQEVRIPTQIRDKHTYLIGKTGSGKSNLIRNMFGEDVENGEGCGLIDPHGDLAEPAVEDVRKRRTRDVFYFNAANPNHVPCFNPFEISPEDDAGKIADDFCASLGDSLVSGQFGPRMQHIIKMAVYSLLKAPNTAFADISRLLSRTDEGQVLRDEVLDYLDNPEAIKFWTESFPSFRESTLFPVIKKLSKILLNDRIYRILSQKESRIDFRRIVDEGKIIIFNLSTGSLGTENTNILGSFILSLFHKVALSRADTPPEKRRPFYLYVDEFHRFKTSSIESMLAEARKYRIALILAHQNTGQLSKEAQKAVGNVSTLISFCVDADDASKVAKEFKKEIEPRDILDLGVGQALAKIDNMLVGLNTFPPRARRKRTYRDDIIRLSQEKYCISLEEYLHRNARGTPGPGPRTYDTL